MEEHVQAHLLQRIATLERHVAGSPEASAILPRLDNLRTAIGEMTSRYDARLTEVKARNQQALSALKNLSERLERVKHATPTTEAVDGSDVQTESPGHFSFSHEATRDFNFGDVGGELCGHSDVASSAEMSFMSPGMYWCDSASMMPANQWDTPTSRNPVDATCNDDSDEGIRTPSPEWSPRGCLLRRVPFPVQPMLHARSPLQCAEQRLLELSPVSPAMPSPAMPAVPPVSPAVMRVDGMQPAVAAEQLARHPAFAVSSAEGLPADAAAEPAGCEHTHES